MRILNAIHAQNIGGVDQVFRNYTEILTKNGHEVALLISQNGKEDYLAKKIFRLRNKSQILDVLHLIWIAHQFKPDVIICHSNRVMKWMRILRFFSKTKSIAINHGITFKNSLNCDFVISINQQIAEMVVAAGFDRSRSFVLHNAIKIDQKFIAKEPKIPLTIGMYGRIEPRKGFDILIEAGGILRKNNCDFRLKFGGFAPHQGYDWSDLKKIASEHEILNHCDYVGTVIDKKKFFEDVDIFCVPSREEPFGLVILEGFLFSTPVISSDTDGGKLLIENGQNGLLFANENPQDLAAKIIELANDRATYAKLSREAFLRLEKDFSFDSLREQFEIILQKTCASRH